MRLADLLLDLAAVASASRSVASKHVALRSRQIERYGKSSNIITNARTAEASRRQSQAQQSVVKDDLKDAPTDQTPPHAKKDPVPAESKTSEGAEPPVKTTPVEKKTSAFSPAPWATGIPPFFMVPQGPRPGAPGTLRKPRIDIASSILESLKEAQEELSKSAEHMEQTFTKSTSGGDGTLVEKETPIVEVKPAEEETSIPKDMPTLEETPTLKKTSEYVEKVARPETPTAKVIPVKTTAPKEVERVAASETPTIPETIITAPAKTITQDDINAAASLAGVAIPSQPSYQLRESRVPSTRIGRLWNYGGLAAGIFAGAIGEGLSRAVGGGNKNGSSVMLSPANMERLVAKLSRMRGAALKMGQMMSFQDAKMLPGPIQEILQRVQDRADYMPAWQRDRVLSANLGPEWRGLFGEFEEKPIAAASIGQVHRATLRSNGERVAVKIQFPGVADSINSDLDNLGVLLAAAKLLPKGLYLNKTIDNARTELAWECDYEREAECAARYRELLKGEDEKVFVVPKIYPEASGKQVLTMEFMDGVGVTRVTSFTQEQRDWIGTQILRLCLREIVEFKFMQTDPNWTNFLYNAQKDRLELLDFGASREYPDEFISKYVRLLEAASRLDRARVKELSEELGYLTGHESKTMLDAHITSVSTLAEPFLQSAPVVYDFRDQTITERVKAQIPVMIHERLAPPPEETYSLHRKLSGAFLLCARLGSRVRCRELFEKALAKSALSGDK